MGYQVDDLSIDLAPRRVSRAGTVIPLKALSFDLLVALVRAAPDVVSFEQLSERVWPGLVVSPETIVQRVKLLRDALGDDPQAPRYIEGVRGRGYRMLAEVRSLTEAVKVRSSSTTPTAPRPASGSPLRWIGGTLFVVTLLAASWALIHYRGVGKPAEQTSSGAAAAIHSLAVLPLENLTGDKEQEYFADGMTDALTTDLAQIGALRVISRTSAMHFKGSKETLPKIGRDLQVDAVVEGTVARSQDRVRITAQLVEASSDRHLWAKTYERDLKDVLVLQDEIAQDVADQIRVKLTPGERSLFMQVRTVDPEAHDAYLRGRYWESTAWESFHTAERMSKGLDYYHEAIAKDPNYALAYAGVADSFIGLGYVGGLPFKEAFPKAKEAAMKALQLDPSLAEAHTALGGVKYSYDWDWAGAEHELQEALTLDPNHATAHFVYAIYLGTMGRFDDAVKELEHARDLDPFSILINDHLGLELYYARRYDDALRQFRRGLEMYPDIGLWSWHMAQVYEQKQMFAEAFAQYHQSISLNKETQRAAALEQAYQRSGYRGAVLQLVQFVAMGPNNVMTNPFQARLYAMLDDEAHAMLFLERAYDERNPSLLLLMADPALDHLRGSPRFRDLVHRIGLPPFVDEAPLGNLPDHEPVRAR